MDQVLANILSNVAPHEEVVISTDVGESLISNPMQTVVSHTDIPADHTTQSYDVKTEDGHDGGRLQAAQMIIGLSSNAHQPVASNGIVSVPVTATSVTGINHESDTTTDDHYTVVIAQAETDQATTDNLPVMVYSGEDMTEAIQLQANDLQYSDAVIVQDVHTSAATDPHSVIVHDVHASGVTETETIISQPQGHSVMIHDARTMVTTCTETMASQPVFVVAGETEHIGMEVMGAVSQANTNAVIIETPVTDDASFLLDEQSHSSGAVNLVEGFVESNDTVVSSISSVDQEAGSAILYVAPTTAAESGQDLVTISDSSVTETQVVDPMIIDYKGEPSEEQQQSLLMINKKRIEEIGTEVITIEPSEGEHECVVCSQKFRLFTELYKHRLLHNQETSSSSMFKCGTCYFTFKEPEELEKHKQLHLDRRVYKCCICQDVYSDVKNYKCHLRIHDRNAHFTCDMCPFTVFSERKHYIAHLDDHELLKGTWVPGRPLTLICNMCGKVFPERYSLKRHQAYQHSEKCFKCTLCQRAFLERSKLTRHMLIHTGKRDYTCGVCDKTFSLKYNLIAHMRIHDGVRPWSCAICRKTFIQKVCLQRHLKVHEGYTIEYQER